jgi:hypothetical protein
MRNISHLVVALSVSLSSAAFAQRSERATQLLLAADLPVSAARARSEGASNADVRGVLDALRNAKVPAHEAREVIDEERSARRRNGPVDNFGAFVQSKLQAGLRGRELAAAIRAEHAARGKGNAAQSKATPAQSKATPARNKATPARNKAAPPARAVGKPPANAQAAPGAASTSRNQKNAKKPSPATKYPNTKARPSGRTTRPTL